MKRNNAPCHKMMKKVFVPWLTARKKVLAPWHSIIFPHTMRQNILYCGKSYSFHRYCRQKILRLIIFAVLPARGIRLFFQFTSIGATAFQWLSAISGKNIAATAFLFCKYLLIGFKVVEKWIRPMAGDCKKKERKCPPYALKQLKQSIRPIAFCTGPMPPLMPGA